MTKKRNLAAPTEQQKYFEAAQAPSPEQDEGTRELGELYPFLISGGTNTERYYFTHINDKTKYKFNIRPRYFGDESNYTEAFPKRILEVLGTNDNAKIFCVFDWDTVYDNEANLKKHEAFESQFKAEIANGSLTLCPSMPSIEYWFLLHFEDYTKFLKNYGKVASVLGKYIKACFIDPSKPLKKLLKKEENLNDSTWVENLCADGKLDLAIERAEKNITDALESGTLEKQSYSFVYKVFKVKSNVIGGNIKEL